MKMAYLIYQNAKRENVKAGRISGCTRPYTDNCLRSLQNPCLTRRRRTRHSLFAFCQSDLKVDCLVYSVIYVFAGVPPAFVIIIETAITYP